MRKLIERLKDVVLSVYIYNEWRGYTQLERDLIPILETAPNADAQFIHAVKRHAADERKHYQMFRGYFLSEGRMPFEIGSSVGYFDMLARWIVGNPEDLTNNEGRFARLCRAVITTELRGIRQLDSLLSWKSINGDERLRRIFQVIRADEPGHYSPYEEWLRKNGHSGPSLWDKFADFVLHYTIATLIIPVHFLNFRMRRRTEFWA